MEYKILIENSLQFNSIDKIFFRVSGSNKGSNVMELYLPKILVINFNMVMFAESSKSY